MSDSSKRSVGRPLSDDGRKLQENPLYMLLVKTMPHHCNRVKGEVRLNVTSLSRAIGISTSSIYKWFDGEGLGKKSMAKLVEESKNRQSIHGLKNPERREDVLTVEKLVKVII